MKEKVVYQLYPKSFYDSDGDGYGDLAGVIEKIPYLEKLGVDMIWFNPFYPSPQNDNGYDISNYCAIDARFGSMETFEELIRKLKEAKIDVMLDMVLNHTSIQHEWFQKALAGDKKYQDYYILREGKSNGEAPTNWASKFVGKAWAQFGNTTMYYLHLYDKTQADLNWRNPEVREELANVVKFWMNKGVKGFRFDVINVIGKEEELIDAEDGIGKSLYTDRPIVHEYLQELHRKTFGQESDVITVGEMSSTNIENAILYTRPDRLELDMVFNFHHLKVDYDEGNKWTVAKMDFQELIGLLHEWGESMSQADGWNALFWNNHDQPRALSRFVDDEVYRVESAKMLAASIHLSRGTPYIYQGEEIGMTNPYYTNLSQYDDVESHNAYAQLRRDGATEKEALTILQSKSRDNSRTPMQWTDEEYAGFSTTTPWLKVADNYSNINVEKELREGSIFSFYQQLIALRKDYPIIALGTYHRVSVNDTYVYAYQREWQHSQLLVMNNFFGEEISVKVPESFVKGQRLIGNYPERPIQKEMILAPYETLAVYVGE